MFRHPMLSVARAAALVLGLLTAAALAPAASAQDRNTEERLERLERDLNMLQRQVYRGVAPTVAADPGNAADAEIRMDRLEAEMRDLTGRVEEFVNRVEVLRQRLEQINSDIEMRFAQSPGGGSPMPPAAPGRRPAPYDPPVASAAQPPAASALPPGTVVPAPSPIFGTLTPPGTAPSRASAPPPDAGGGAARPAAAGSGGLPAGAPAEQYNYALGLLKQADYPAAERALRAFIAQHPDHVMAGSAQYWIGETYYARGKFAEAAAAFAEGYKRYPKGPKASEGLLKLAMSLARLHQKDNACVALAQLDREFPNLPASVRERSGAEKKRLGC